VKSAGGIYRLKGGTSVHYSLHILIGSYNHEVTFLINLKNGNTGDRDRYKKVMAVQVIMNCKDSLPGSQ
jgi:hypothetical protein